MESHSNILLFETFGTTLNSREDAKRLFANLIDLKKSTVYISFKNIEFTSRSFADQFIKELEKSKSSHKVNFIISDISENSRKMLSIVKETQNKTKRTYKEYPVYHFSNKESLSDYLLSI